MSPLELILALLGLAFAASLAALGKFFFDEIAKELPPVEPPAALPPAAPDDVPPAGVALAREEAPLEAGEAPGVAPAPPAVPTEEAAPAQEAPSQAEVAQPAVLAPTATVTPAAVAGAILPTPAVLEAPPPAVEPVPPATEPPAAVPSIFAPPAVPAVAVPSAPAVPAVPAVPSVPSVPSVPPVAAPEREPVAPPQPETVPAPSVPAVAVPIPVDKPEAKPAPVDPEAARREQRARYREGLTKTRKGFIARLADVFRGKPKVDQNLKDEIEEILFTADIGAATAQKLLEEVSAVLDRKEIADEDAVWSVIRNKAMEILDVGEGSTNFTPEHGPYTLLMIGVNGVGKTTTLGKLAARHAEEGRRVLLVAGDTFRAAAGEQLDVWARRVGCDIHLGKDGADPSSVIFDGIARARREGHDVVLCDTAGRLHTKKELMDELQKIRRSASKALSQGREATVEAHDTLLALDATIGQNALSQAQLFKETMAFTGVVLTKLDGTAKGGVILGICDELKVPVRYIGIGERVADLRDFDAEAFVDAVFVRPDEA